LLLIPPHAAKALALPPTAYNVKEPNMDCNGLRHPPEVA
jgi:hypothetical protein